MELYVVAESLPALTPDAQAAASAAASGMGASIKKAEPVPAYSYMTKETAEGLSPESRQMFSFREQRAEELKRSEQGSGAGISSYAATLERDQINAARAVEAVREMTAKMGAPTLPVTYTMDHYPTATADHYIGTGKPAGITISRGMTGLLDDQELRYVAGHEMAHINGDKSELKADAQVVKATCNLSAAKSAITKIYAAQGVPEGKAADETHPPLQARLSNMQEVYDQSSCKATPTPGYAGGTPSLPSR